MSLDDDDGNNARKEKGKGKEANRQCYCPISRDLDCAAIKRIDATNASGLTHNDDWQGG